MYKKAQCKAAQFMRPGRQVLGHAESAGSAGRLGAGGAEAGPGKATGQTYQTA